MRSNEEAPKKYKDKYFKFRCTVCEAYVGCNSKHCSVCNKCISGFDHHCEWLNNCIGDRNFHLFFKLVIVYELNSIVQLLVSILLFLSL